MSAVDFTYPGSDQFLRRRRLGLLLRRLGLRPPEKPGPAEIAAKAAELSDAERRGLVERPFDYGADVRKSYLGYADGRIAATEDHTFYPRLFYTAIRDSLGEDRAIRSVINFGAFFANVDATLALLNPEIEFRAVDYDPEIKSLNESVFCGRNIKFVAGAIEAAIADSSYPHPALLAHCKTACLMYPAKMQQLYKLAAQSGVTHIVGVENTGFCLGTGDFYRFSDEPKPSAFYKSTMFVHNYPAMLRAAGYQVRRGRVAYDDLNHAIVFVASRA